MKKKSNKYEQQAVTETLNVNVFTNFIMKLIFKNKMDSTRFEDILDGAFCYFTNSIDQDIEGSRHNMNFLLIYSRFIFINSDFQNK